MSALGGKRTSAPVGLKHEKLDPVRRMNTGIQSLSEREKETLRLLIRGHNAKSIAHSLGLSVHTVNDRLRDARRKLNVSSSREAARRLAESEQWSPYSIGGKELGVAGNAANVRWSGLPDHRQGRGKALTWLIGGILIMSLIIAAVMILSNLAGSNGTVSGTQAATSPASATSSESAALKSALEWVALVDQQRWEQSWGSAGTLFKSQVTAASWAASVQPVRKPLGAVSTRTLQSAKKHSSLPGAPAGEYEMVEFKTSFANKKNALETVVLTREISGWKVIGYFVR